MIKEHKIFNEIVSKYSLSVESIIHESETKLVYLLCDNNNNKYVLKMYKSTNKNIIIEQKILFFANNRAFKYIDFPKLIDCGDNYILIEFRAREYLTRDTIFERCWSSDDIKLWVEGLNEFQRKIHLNRRWFSLKKRLIGFLYPVFRNCQIIPKIINEDNFSAQFTLIKISICYLFSKLFFHNVVTHYDFQTQNYTFMKNERKMSVIDLEIPYYLGDPLFDLLYFITIPTKRFSEWTIQYSLLNSYLQLLNKKKNNRKLITINLIFRIRAILLICNLNRYIAFKHQPEKSIIYCENIILLLNKKKFRNWLLTNCWK